KEASSKARKKGMKGCGFLPAGEGRNNEDADLSSSSVIENSAGCISLEGSCALSFFRCKYKRV
ncbi:hypothetical protein ACIKN0_13110, partial [Pediococcus acidilactici]|uniref:hypothetical protein n=1 Tax=Pediococcus acidilactici TaxID=1254 RepID=UPI003A905042